MLATWTKILPFFIIEWLAKRSCERIINYSVGTFVNPYTGVLIRVPQPPPHHINCGCQIVKKEDDD